MRPPFAILNHVLRPRGATPRAVARSSRSIYTHSGKFEPFVPPTPQSLGGPKKAKTYPRTTKWLRRLFYTSAIIGGGWFLDKTFYASVITRSARTFGLGLWTALDYKLNFREHPLLGGTIGDLHRRSAERLFDVLRVNGGLYLKIGQAIAMQSAIMPPEFQKMFARMFDDAPQNSWKDVEAVIREDFGKSPEEVFGISFTGEEGKGVMEKAARASASVAQVHWAKLADGREVAVKIQKREIARQVEWDLWAFKVMMKVYTTWFDLPLYNLVPYITERLALETDFQVEAQNSIKMAALVEGEPRLRDRVYIPKVYPELSTKRVMTAEWIEGVRLWDKDGIQKPWRGGNGKGSPGVAGAPLDAPDRKIVIEKLKNSPGTATFKPERNQWKGPRQNGGLGLSVKEVMTTMIDLFSAQMFLWGLVHCDPHPGNIFIRRLPSGRSQLVLIDHGLYISMNPEFRHQYATFWKALLSFDNSTIEKVSAQWGVKQPDVFASATLMRPYQGGDMSTQKRITDDLKGRTNAERHYEVQQRMFQGIRDVLSDEEKWPRELLFIGRNMRIVQGNNQFLGSPVNRIRLTGYWASRALAESKDLRFDQRWKNRWGHVKFSIVLWLSDVVFLWSRLRQWLGLGLGMEADMEEKLKSIAKDTFGVELQHGVFDG